jgi:hypothetical protein
LTSIFTLAFSLNAQQSAPPSILFELKPFPFQLDSNVSPAFNPPESMAGGVAVFDYNGDGRPDIFFTNGADLATLKKSFAKYSNRLFRNEGNGLFADVTSKAGLEGTGFNIAAAVGDYDNDGHPDLFVTGVHGNTLYRNNGDGTFTDVTSKAGLDKWHDPEYGPLWGAAAAWVDVNNDGLLDLFVVNYVRWTYQDKPVCNDYCHPRYFKGTPSQLFINQGNETFADVSKEWGIRDYVGKGMGVAVADYDLDGKPDLFVTNDSSENFMFHNLGNKFEETGFQTGTMLPAEGQPISGMGLDFRDFKNEGYPGIVYVALNDQTFPILANPGKGQFEEITASSGIRAQSLSMSGYGAALYDFDNDGWKDLFVSRGHSSWMSVPPGVSPMQPNSVFRNPGAKGKWEAITAQAGFVESTAAHHRGCAFGDFDSDGRVDAIVSSLEKNAELWMNRSPKSNHWIEIELHGVKSNRDGIGAQVKIVTRAGVQHNHQTSAVCYASSSLGPVHFGMAGETKALSIEIHWPSGIEQMLNNVDADQIVKVTEPVTARPIEK